MDECDVVVPRANVAEFVLYSHSLQEKHGVRIRSFGHAGDGNLHIYVLRDELGDEAWKAKARMTPGEQEDFRRVVRAGDKAYPRYYNE